MQHTMCIYIYIYVYIHITGKSVAFFTSILLVFGCMKCSKSWILWSGKVSATCWSWSRSRSAVLRMTSDRLRNLLVILSFLILQISSWLPFLLFRSTTTSTPALVAAVASEVRRFAEILGGPPMKKRPMNRHFRPMELKDTRRRHPQRSWRLEASKILHPERTKIWGKLGIWRVKKIPSFRICGEESSSGQGKVDTFLGAPKRPFRFEWTGLAGARGQQRCW